MKDSQRKSDIYSFRTGQRSGKVTTFKDTKDMMPTVDLCCKELRENRTEFIKKALKMRLRYLKGKINVEIPERLLL